MSVFVAAALLVGACSGGASQRSAAHGVSGPPAAPTSVGTPPVARQLPPELRAGAEWDRLPTTRPVVALTFDAGGDDAGAAKILPTLRGAGIPATFFITGRFALTFPEIVRDIASTYAIGNHTYDHRDLTKLAAGAAAAEVTSGAAILRQVTGRDPLPLFRFPFGAENDRLRALVNRLGYGDIRWTVDTLGWMGTSGGQSASSALSRVLADAAPGEIVLLHLGAHPKDHSTIDADALGAIIAALRARGYTFVSLDQFLI
jgi:peptidoglycan/xylan/chitin deacetylase (PgdA/CDA1 family)